jgi:hypothetical protein
MITNFKSAISQPVMQDVRRVLYTALMIGGGIIAAYWMESLLRALD